jgi:hypothetical protein
MRLHAEAARLRLGELLGSEEGAALTAQAHANMQSLGVVNPARWAGAYAPGF